MNNYIMVNGQRIELTQEQVERIIAASAVAERELSSFTEGDVVKIGQHEMVVLEHAGAATVLIRKDLIADDEEFGENNNYNGSNVDAICNRFGDDLISTVGEENVLRLAVDLTSDDGLKDYGSVTRLAALLTADQYRRYVHILDKHKLDAWWWLATPHSTPTHENANWVRCVSPSGDISIGSYNSGYGVRPFCILKSNIFVSA